MGHPFTVKEFTLRYVSKSPDLRTPIGTAPGSNTMAADARPALHLYAHLDDLGYLAAQQSFSAAHPWL